MKIAVLGPCDLLPFMGILEDRESIPPTYSFPYIAQLVYAYLERGHEVEIVTSSEHIDTPKRWQSSIGLNVSVVPKRSRARDRAFDLFERESSWISEATRDAQPDVIHAHWLYEFASGGLDVQSDALITAHDAPISVIRHYGRHPYWWFREFAGIRNLRRVINLTAVAPTLSLELQPFVRRNTSIDVIPNGLNLGAGGPDSPRYKVNNCSRPSFAVVANGFDRRKNSSAALHAFRKVREKLPSSVLHMFGQGHEPGGKAFAWAAKRGLIENVQFHGVHSHASLQSFINFEVDIMVHPSRWEACSLAILESRSMGVPVIGAKHAGGVGFTLDAGLSGDLVAQRPGAYANAMLNLATDSGAYMRKAKQAREGLTPTFDMAIVTQLYIDRLQKILEVR